LAPDERFSMVRLGMAYLEQWDVGGARRTLQRLLEDAPNDTLVQYLRAQVLFHEGDYAGAEKTLDGMPTTPVVRGADEFTQLVRDTRKATAKLSRHETPHFIIYYLAGRDDILVPYAEETLEKAYEVLGRDLKYHPAEKVRVEIYPDSDSFISVTTLTKNEIETSGTIALCKFNRLMITSPRVLVRGYSWRDTLVHEYIHYILSRKSNNQVPLWLHEGVAKFQETRWRENEIGLLSPISASLLAEALENNYFITIEQMHPSLAKLKSKEDAQLAFAEVETMVGFLVRKGGYPLLNRLLDEFAAGRENDEALRNVGGWATMDAFLAEWKAYLRERGLRRIPGLTILPTTIREGGATEDRDDLNTVKNAAARKHVRLGDMLRDRKRFEASVYEYRKATEAGGDFNPVLHHKLGLAQVLAGDTAGAERSFLEALSVYPHFGPVNLRLGELYVGNKAYQKARRPLETALGINPFDPKIHSLLLETYRQLGEEALAKRQEEVLALLHKGTPQKKAKP
jgi:tetratricopeptide (TPR) repeat protein